MKKDSRAKAITSSLLSMVSVQSGSSIAKRLFPYIGPEGALTLRVGLSAIILFLINRPSLRRLTPRQWKYCILYGMCLAGMNVTFYYSIVKIPIGLAVAVEFIGPLTLAMLFSRKLLDLVWVLLAVAGIVLIVPWSSHGVDAAGLLLAVCAGVFWALYILVGGRISMVMGKRDSVTVGMCVAAVLIVPIGLFSGTLCSLNAHLLLMGFGLAVFSSAIPYSLELIALGSLPPKTFGILMSLQPAFGALSGLFFLGEMLTLNQWLSILCVIMASIGTTATSSGTKPQAVRQDS